jgi:acetylglutamate kinase
LHEVDESTDSSLEIHARETTDSIVRRLIEEGVSAVSLQGSDREMFTSHDAGLRVSRMDTVFEMARLGAVPVISVIAKGESGGVVSVSMYAAALEVAGAAGGEGHRAVVFTSNLKKGLSDHKVGISDVRSDDLERFSGVVDVKGVNALVGRFEEVWITNTAGMGAEGGVEGTRVRA